MDKYTMIHTFLSYFDMPVSIFCIYAEVRYCLKSHPCTDETTYKYNTSIDDWKLVSQQRVLNSKHF